MNTRRCRGAQDNASALSLLPSLSNDPKPADLSFQGSLSFVMYILYIIFKKFSNFKVLLVGMVRIELTTSTLSAWRSRPTELHSYIKRGE